MRRTTSPAISPTRPRMPEPSGPRLAALLTLFVATACGGEATGPSDGRDVATLTVRVVAVGAASDPDGVTVGVGGEQRVVVLGGETTFEVPAGELVVTLSGLSDGCSTEQGRHRSREVAPGGSVEVRWDVMCGDDQVIVFWTLPPCTDPVACVGGGRAEGGAELYTLRSDGSNPLRLTDGPEWKYDPTWSPDRDRIAFTRGRISEQDLSLVVRPHGHGDEIVLQVPEGAAQPADPAWSPDGTRIAYAFGGTIRVVQAGGGVPVEIQSDGESPAWSPDGTRIVFVRETDGRTDLWTMSAEGGDELRLTDTPDTDETLPTWSPDGARIAYRRSALDLDEVRTVASDGSDDRLLYHDHWVGHLAWAPSGTSLIAVVDMGNVLGLGTLAADGSLAAPLYQGEFTAGDPHW